jgi:hypothetical protein
MTEDEWLMSTDPQPMLAFVQGSGHASDRKLRLFAIAAVRRVWHLLRDESEEIIRDAVLAAEQLADGAITTEAFSARTRNLGGHPIVWAAGGYELNQAAKPEWAPIAAVEFAVLAAEGAIRGPAEVMLAGQFAALAEATAWFIDHGPQYAASHLEEHLGRLGPAGSATYTATFRQGANLWRKQVLTANGWEWETETEVVPANGYAVLAALANARVAQANLVRDIFGSLPFRSSRSLSAGVLDWSDGLIVRMANAIYEERSLPEGTFDAARLAVLADALTDAGCQDAELLEHLRLPGPHVRGFFGVDLILSKDR